MGFLEKYKEVWEIHKNIVDNSKTNLVDELKAEIQNVKFIKDIQDGDIYGDIQIKNRREGSKDYLLFGRKVVNSNLEMVDRVTTLLFISDSDSSIDKYSIIHDIDDSMFPDSGLTHEISNANNLHGFLSQFDGSKYLCVEFRHNNLLFPIEKHVDDDEDEDVEKITIEIDNRKSFPVTVDNWRALLFERYDSYTKVEIKDGDKLIKKVKATIRGDHLVLEIVE